MGNASLDNKEIGKGSKGDKEKNGEKGGGGEEGGGWSEVGVLSAYTKLDMFRCSNI